MRTFTFLTVIGLLLVFTAVLVVADGRRHSVEVAEPAADRALARTLHLTDLSIWTEARYTRHPSQADLFAPFQSLPSALEHFPSGSWVRPSLGYVRSTEIDEPEPNEGR